MILHIFDFEMGCKNLLYIDPDFKNDDFECTANITDFRYVDTHGKVKWWK